MNITPEDAPDSWFEKKGSRIIDTVQAVFLKDGQSRIVLAIRQALFFTIPIAVLGDGSVWFVSEAQIVGLFSKEVRLLLADENRRPLALRIPLKALMDESRDSLPRFLQWIRDCSPILKAYPSFPTYLFSNGLQMAE